MALWGNFPKVGGIHMEEIFEVKFANSEQDFIHAQGINRGWYQLPVKIGRCYFISSEAKSLYSSLGQYCYQGSRECYPGRETLKQELGGWGNDRLDKAIKELKEANLVSVEKKDGKKSTYILEELQYSKVLAHSELVHEIRVNFKSKGKQEEFYKALTSYRKSDFCYEVSNLPNPIGHSDLICDWFTTYIEGNQPESDNKREKLEEVKQQPVTSIKTWSIEGIERSANENEKPKKEKKSKDFNEVDIDRWNTNHFLGYFDTIFTSKKKLPYPPSKGDLGALKHLISQTNDNQRLRELINKYFEQFDNWSVHNFSSSYVQQKLINELNNSPSNSYKKNRAKSTDVDVDDPWLQKLRERSERK